MVAIEDQASRACAHQDLESRPPLHQYPTPELQTTMPFLPDPIPNPAMDPTSKPTKQQLPSSPLHPTSDETPRLVHPASAMTRSATFSGPSKPSSFLIKQLEAMAVGPDKPDKKAAAALTALTKCRSLNGGPGRGKEGGRGEAEEKSVASEVGWGRRRSLVAADVDVGCVFAGAGARVVAKDMPPFMMVHAVTFARKAFDGMEKFSSKTLAFGLKKEFDGVYGPAWHCIVGTSFGSFVTHSVGGFLYFSLDKLHILLFKTTVQRAD